jgi:hypothetical protein
LLRQRRRELHRLLFPLGVHHGVASSSSRTRRVADILNRRRPQSPTSLFAGNRQTPYVFMLWGASAAPALAAAAAAFISFPGGLRLVRTCGSVQLKWLLGRRKCISFMWRGLHFYGRRHHKCAPMGCI